MSIIPRVNSETMASYGILRANQSQSQSGFDP